MIKYIKSDINDGITSLKAGLCNIVSGIINREFSDYVIDIPININTLQDLIRFSIPKAFVSYNYNRVYKEDSKPSFYILVDDHLLEVFDEEEGYKFTLVR